MRTMHPNVLALVAAAVAIAPFVNAACCYFSAKNTDILQPAQKVFITYDPVKKIETFTVQPRFEGNALDFGMVIPTPSQPKLDEMPKEFFNHLAVYTILKRREVPQSRLLQLLRARAATAGGMYRKFPRTLLTRPPLDNTGNFGNVGNFGNSVGNAGNTGHFGNGGNVGNFGGMPPPPPPVRAVETGVVGALDYKILQADRADALFQWLKDNKYHYGGDEATLDFYVRQKWCFTVMKIDTAAMKKNKDGTYLGEVTPTRFQFTSDKIVYPLKITQLSVKDKTEALFYVQTSHKVDLPDDWSYQYTWVPMLQAASGCTPGGIRGGGEEWVKALGPQVPVLLKRAEELGFVFFSGQRPRPNAKGHVPTTMEWARNLTAADIDVLQGEASYSEKVPLVDEGFTAADMSDPKKSEAAAALIRERLEKSRKERPFGYAVRHAPEDALKGLAQLAGHLQEGQFVTKFRKIFCRDEMNADLVLVPARRGEHKDTSEYEEMLPTSPP